MRDILETISKHFKEIPDKVALVDREGQENYTYANVEYISGKVYAYLKKKGIGKEDFVAISLPRSAQPIIAMVGVWRAGAAFVMIEENYAPERTAYIKRDCHCKLTIDTEVWEEIQRCEEEEGYCKIDPHDAALAIYTSGSTGNPKGVIHEFGNIGMIDASNNYHGVYNISADEVDGLIIPLTFIAGAAAAMMALMAGCTLHVIPYSIVKSPDALSRYMYEHKITKMSMSPTLYRACKNFSPSLKKIFMGGEPVNGIYNEDIQIISAYSMSECGFLIAAYEIDKMYERTPLGKPQFDLKYWILDEDGNEVQDGEDGELCVEVPYIRGYVNLPELTEEVFKEHIYHSGDIVRKLPDGNLLHVGRSNDMIKINGNRVEPGEIEAAVKKVLGIDWACAKGFVDEKSAFICLYYVADIDVDYENVRTELLKYLPYYMIPAHFVKLDKIPQNANGKVDKKSLQPPKREACRGKYEEPVSELEKKICAAFEEILQLEQIGLNDDFYQLGGDSLGAMKLIMLCGEKTLSVNEIFKGRTPKKIAELVEEKLSHIDWKEEEISEEEMRRPHKILQQQIQMIDYQLYAPKSTMFNLGGLLRFEKSVDAQRLADAVNQVIDAHPVLNTTFAFSEDGEIIQKYTPELAKKVEVEKISEDELEQIKDELIQPFKIIKACLHRCRVFETEKAIYLFMDMHHTIFDGTSSQVLMKDIEQAYNGKTLKRDSYYKILKEREHLEDTPEYFEAKKYFEDNYFQEGYEVAPTADKQTRETELGAVEDEIEISAEKIDHFKSTINVSRNEFFIGATMLALKKYNKADKIKVTWVYNGRTSMEEASTVGLLLKTLPVKAEIHDDDRVAEIFKDIHEQVVSGIEHSSYPYEKYYRKSALEDDETSVIYQNVLHNLNSKMCGSTISTVEIEQQNEAYENILDIEISDAGDEFELLMEYATSLYEETSIESFKNIYKEICMKLTQFAENTELRVKDVIA